MMDTETHDPVRYEICCLDHGKSAGSQLTHSSFSSSIHHLKAFINPINDYVFCNISVPFKP